MIFNSLISETNLELVTTQNKKAIFFQSLGCAKNLVDTEVMLGISLGDGFKLATAPEEAEVIVVNTCSFIEASKKESIESILEMAEYKTTGKCERLIVAGCLPQRYKADLKVSFPEVDAFLGTGQYGRILEFVGGKFEEEEDFRHPKYIHSESTPRINTQPSHRAYLKISEGCIKGCAFCIIPRIRGTLRSRTIPSLVAEASKLATDGVLELNLIAQDLSDYGKDLGDGTSLAKLLRALAKVEGVRWLRLLYLYPDELSGELLEVIAAEEKICKYIDMPVQHINDRMLRLMNRKITGGEIRERISTLKKSIPDVSLRSTVIVGYPGETKEEYEQLEAFVEEEAPFDHLGVFTYSHEENTASYRLPDQLPDDVKIERRNRLMEKQRDVSSKRLTRWVGKTLPVLVEGLSEESEFLIKGRHAGQAPDIDGHILIRAGQCEVGKIFPVKIERAMEYDLIGRVTTQS